MATNDLDAPTIPVLLLDGTLQHPSISADTTAQDLIETLIQLDDVKCTVLDAAPSAWALQRVRKEKPGRLWDERELLTLGDGEILPDIRRRPVFYVQGRISVIQASSHPHRSSPHSLINQTLIPALRPLSSFLHSR